MIKKMTEFIKNETVFVVSFILAGISMIFVPISFDYINYIDFKVIGCLFCLMAVVCMFENIGLFKLISVKFIDKAYNMRYLFILIVFMTFFASMVITNDVALITFVPLTLTVLKMCGQTKYAIWFVVLQTVAANIGSSCTPVGNPQNLYLYSYYNMSMGQFFGTVVPIVIFGGILLLISALFVKKENIKISDMQKPNKIDKFRFSLYMLLFVLSILAVFDVVKYWIAIIVIVAAICIADKKAIKQIDYLLLLTFVWFFVFVGNMANIEAVKQALIQLLKGREFIISIVASQFISNVPAAVMLSKFTEVAEGVLAGVNVGGCGTLIASMASVISYKLFCADQKCQSGKYIKIFTFINAIFLGFLIVFYFVYY